MKISVVITAYNVEQYIEECIKSVLAQVLEVPNELEVIVVEDLSTDNTLEVIKSIKGIKIFLNEVNVGAGMSRRYGIEQATGDYVMLLDGDDYIKDINHLNRLLTEAIATDADVVSGGIMILKEDGSYDTTSYGEYTCEGYEKISKFWGERIVFMNNKIIRRSLYEKVPYCHRRYIEDTPVIIPILYYANKVEYVDSIGYVYRMRNNSLTHEADAFKNLVFKGLCWCDLMEFFNSVDPKVFDHIDIKGYIQNTISVLNRSILTPQIVLPYANEFTELMMRLINLILVTSINFKHSNK